MTLIFSTIAILWVVLFIVNLGTYSVIVDPNETKEIQHNTPASVILLLFVFAPLFSLVLFTAMGLVGAQVFWEWVPTSQQPAKRGIV